MFSILICINKKGHFASFMKRHLNQVCVNCVWKSCICKHSDKGVLDHNRNLQKSYLRRYIASSLTDLFTNLKFMRSLWKQLLEEVSVDRCACRPFLSINSKLLLLHLSYCYCLLFFTAVNANKLLQKLRGRWQSSVLTICLLHAWGGLLVGIPCFLVEKLKAKFSGFKLLFVFEQ